MRLLTLERHQLRRLPLLRALCAAAMSLSIATTALAQSSVAVLVNDEPVTSFDVQNRARMLSLFSRGQQGQEQALEQLIDERLMMQEAKRVGMVADDAAVEEEFAERAQQVNLTPEQFNQALRQSGVDPQTFKDFLRANMSWSAIVRARFRSSEDVTDQDVAAELEQRKTAGPAADVFEYLLQPVIFIVPEKAGQGVEAQRQSQAKAFRAGFRGCDQSLDQVGGMTGVVVKPTLRREQHQLTESLRKELESLGVGGVTEPQRVEDGVQVLAVCEKRVVSGQTQAAEEIRDEITSKRGQLFARRYLRDLRSDAVIEYR